ncbi:hypothetical protein Tco_0121171 [Tanacetum coccineum]
MSGAASGEIPATCRRPSSPTTSPSPPPHLTIIIATSTPPSPSSRLSPAHRTPPPQSPPMPDRPVTNSTHHHKPSKHQPTKCPGVLGGDTCEGYIFITARVFLEGTPAMGTYGFHYCPGVLGGDTYDGYVAAQPSSSTPHSFPTDGTTTESKSSYKFEPAFYIFLIILSANQLSKQCGQSSHHWCFGKPKIYLFLLAFTLPPLSIPKGIMPTEMELTLEQTQQGVSYEVSVDPHGFEGYLKMVVEVPDSS